MDEEETQEQSELAHANHVRVFESNVLHASDVLYWLDASSADSPADMSRVPHALQINFTNKPSDVKILNSVGKTALWRTPVEPMVEGYASEAQRTRPVEAGYPIAGEVVDRQGRYNPKIFSATVGAGSGVGIELFPALARITIPPAGAVHGHVQFLSTDNPAVWALLELEVTVGVAQTQTFRAQADNNGDFVMALNQLPPLPEGVTEYAAVLRITADTALDAEDIPDDSTFVAMELESTSVAADFQTDLVLEIRPGENARINSFNKNHVAIQTA